MPRKSPYRHDVKQHTREGHLVHHYKRGEGKEPRATIGVKAVSRPQVIGAKTTHGGVYRVNINYADSEAFTPTGARYPVSHGRRTEHLTVHAGSYLEAMDKGLVQGGAGTPISVMMRRL